VHLGVVVGPKVIDTYILSRLLSPGNEHKHGLKPLTQQDVLKAEELVRQTRRVHEFFKAEAAAHAPKGTMRSTAKDRVVGVAEPRPHCPRGCLSTQG
jgi:hypothetical protein